MATLARRAALAALLNRTGAVRLPWLALLLALPLLLYAAATT